jgi:Na+-transporting NADH:ubiquinone oxidoreductase subunit NqrC
MMTQQATQAGQEIIDKVRKLLEAAGVVTFKIDKVEVSKLGFDLLQERVDLDLGNGVRITLQVFTYEGRYGTARPNAV